jgi:hypothetical protein
MYRLKIENEGNWGWKGSSIFLLLLAIAIIAFLVSISLEQWTDSPDATPQDHEPQMSTPPHPSEKPKEAEPPMQPRQRREEDRQPAVVTDADPCKGRDNSPDWSYIEGTTSCQFAQRLLSGDTWAIGVYETSIQFGQRVLAPIATVRNQCRKIFLPLLAEVSLLENFGYQNPRSRELKHIALRCIGDIVKRQEPNRDDATAILAEADRVAKH